MSDDERVSVVLPYRDAADTLRDALESVLAERVELELLAIDDGSRDEGPGIVAELAARDERVVPLTSHGAGLVAALEQGRREARGRWIARMDADDIGVPGRLAVQREALRASPRLGAIGARVELFGEEVGEGMQRYVAWQNALVSAEEHARDLFVEAPLCHPSVMLRREALDAVGGYRDVGWAEDYDLWLRLDAAGWQLAKVPEVLLRWRQRKTSATFTSPRYAPDALRAARAAFLAPKLEHLGRPFAIWGAGPTGRRLARALEPHGARAASFVDIDPRKIGRIARGVRITSPDALVRGERTVVVAVGAQGARQLVRDHLAARGFVEGLDFVCAA
jgi:glycosyltransferase involved in cell wall biosynthesis